MSKEKELMCYKCTIEHYIGAYSYSIFFAKIYAHSKAEAMRIAAAKTDRFKKCKIEQEFPAPDAVHGTMERIM